MYVGQPLSLVIDIPDYSQACNGQDAKDMLDYLCCTKTAEKDTDMRVIMAAHKDTAGYRRGYSLMFSCIV